MKTRTSTPATRCRKTVAHRLTTACARQLLPLLLLLALPAAVQAQFTYVINNGTITVTGLSDTGYSPVTPGLPRPMRSLGIAEPL